MQEPNQHQFNRDLSPIFFQREHLEQRMLCCFSRADALPPWLFVLADALSSWFFVLADALPPIFNSDGCFVVVIVSFGGCLAPFSCLLYLGINGDDVSLLQVQLRRCLFGTIGLCCAFLQFFSIFSHLCSCVGQSLFGHINLCLFSS